MLYMRSSKGGCYLTLVDVVLMVALEHLVLKRSFKNIEICCNLCLIQKFSFCLIEAPPRRRTAQHVPTAQPTHPPGIIYLNAYRPIYHVYNF